VVPTATVEKLIELAEKVTGALPGSRQTHGLRTGTALSVNVKVPAAEPTAIGEKVTPTVQLAPAAMLVPQV